ncbi:MAG: ABC transporter substrate-binding protein [Clostridia bacterium]|nr:ABC transporter substrate-binding protein [Clostridia bacterium]
MSKKLIALLMAAMMLLSVAAACGKTETPAPEATQPAATTPGATTPAATTPAAATEKVYKTYLAAEVASLNFLDNVDSNSSTPASYAMSRMWIMYPNETGTNYVWHDDLAVGDPIQVDDYNWQIKLREGATFQNGDPINADTWMFTFQQQLNPKTAFRMATFLYDNSVTIVNGAEYLLQGTEGYPAEVKWEDVGLKKIDEYTIQITTTDVHTDPNTIKTHFDNRNLTPINQAMWEQCMSADGLTTSYGSDLDHFVGCGPYYFTSWEYDSIQIYEKNPEHWNSDLYNFDKIEVRIVPEMNARVELFEKGDIYSFSPDANTIESYLDDPRMTTYGSTSVTHIDINCANPNNPISGSVNYRKALYHAIDRELAADSIFGHMAPSGTYVNEQAGMLSANGLTYRESEYGQAVTAMVESWGPYGYNPEMALDYLNKAIAECGVTDAQLPITIKYCIDEGDTEWKALGEYLMEQFPVMFDGKLALEIVPYAGMSATDFKKTGDDKWDLSPNDWTRGMSRTYPHTCFYYYLSTYSGRPNNYVVAEFDAQFQACEDVKLGDYDNLLKETQKLEEMYLDYVIHVPVCQNINYELFTDNIELPVKTYIPGFGWGAIFGDLVG